MIEPVKPMLAAPVTIAELERCIYPMRMQPKLDGIRCLIINGKAFSRSGKLIPNHYVQQWVHDNRTWNNGLDGELLCEDPTSPTCYNTTSSQIMTRAGIPTFKFWVFDCWHLEFAEYHHRRQWLTQHLWERIPEEALPFVQMIPETEVSNPQDIETGFGEMLEAGHEGAILRSPTALYKNGRSTLRQGYLLKLKDFIDDEAVVVGHGELLRNGNGARKSELGFTVRSSHQANMQPAGCLGYLKCVPYHSNAWWTDVDIGTGFDQATRDSLWAQRESLPGRIVKFKYMPSGSKDKPRHPVFLGFRDQVDLG